MTPGAIVPSPVVGRLKVLWLVMTVSMPIDQTTLLGGHDILAPNTLRWVSALAGLGIIWFVLASVPGAMASVVNGAAPWLLLVPLMGVAFAPASLAPAASVAFAAWYLVAAVAAVLLSATVGMPRLARWITAALTIQLAIGIPVEVLGPVDPVALEISTDSGLVGLGRFRGTFAHPNDLGRAAALLVVFASLVRPGRVLRSGRLFPPGRVFSPNRLLSPDHQWIQIGLGVSMLVLSQSRTAVIALVVAVAFSRWQVMTGRRRLEVGAIVGAIGVVVVVVLVIVPSVVRVVERNDNPGELTTLTGRTAIWAASVDAVVDAPLVGVGFAGAGRALDDAFRRGSLDRPARHAHNGVLHVGLIAGLPAATALLVGALRLRRQLAASDLAPLGVFVLVASLTEPLFAIDGGWLEIVLFGLAGGHVWDIAPSGLQSSRTGSYDVDPARGV